MPNRTGKQKVALGLAAGITAALIPPLSLASAQQAQSPAPTAPPGASSGPEAGPDRRSGNCQGLAFSFRTHIGFGTKVDLLGGGAAPGKAVQLLFRRRGQSDFVVRRSLTANSDGRFAASYIADDDYQIYARTAGCDSAVDEARAGPTITGPATAKAGDTVRLIVAAPPRTAVTIAFQTPPQRDFVTRRRGVTDSAGTYRTSYRADRTYLYYARAHSGETSGPRQTRISP